MDIKSVEDAIIARLGSQISPTDAKVEGFPDNPETYNFNHPKAAILVQYQSSDFIRSRVLDTINQVAVLNFNIILMARDLRSHTGAYSLLDQIRTALTGFQPSPNPQGISKLQPTREEFVDQTSGVWTYSIAVTCNGRNEEI